MHDIPHLEQPGSAPDGSPNASLTGKRRVSFGGCVECNPPTTPAVASHGRCVCVCVCVGACVFVDAYGRECVGVLYAGGQADGWVRVPGGGGGG